MLNNCPTAFYENCSNAMLLCHKCKAGSPRAVSFKYEPIRDLGIHPYQESLQVQATSKPKKDQAKSHMVKQALKGERTQIKKIATHLAKATQGSGRVRGDGDALHLGDLRVERKHRCTSQSVTVAKDELAKGEAQDISVYEIYLAQTKKTYYVLTEDTYLELLSYAAQEFQTN